MHFVVVINLMLMKMSIREVIMYPTLQTSQRIKDHSVNDLVVNNLALCVI